jgi:hypothetical protein
MNDNDIDAIYQRYLDFMRDRVNYQSSDSRVLDFEAFKKRWNEFDDEARQHAREMYRLGFSGSVEAGHSQLTKLREAKSASQAGTITR